MNQETFIAFLENLIRDEEKQIFFVVENLRVHKSQRVTAWAETQGSNRTAFPVALLLGTQS